MIEGRNDKTPEDLTQQASRREFFSRVSGVASLAVLGFGSWGLFETFTETQEQVEAHRPPGGPFLSVGNDRLEEAMIQTAEISVGFFGVGLALHLRHRAQELIKAAKKSLKPN